MKKISIISIAALSIFALASFTSAATIDQLQPAQTITYNEDLTVNGTGRFDSAYIGKTTGEGGVTFFNGTMINASEGDTPLTMGDDLRVDGMIWRGPSKGTSDNMPLKIADSVVPALNNANDFGSSTLQWRDGYFAGDVRVGNLLGSGVVGYNNLDTSNSASANQVLSYDGNNLKWTTVGTSSGGSGSGNVVVGDITSVVAGTGIIVSGGGSGDATVSLDSSYIDNRYVNVTGDTMTDGLIVQDASYSTVYPMQEIIPFTYGSDIAVQAMVGETAGYVNIAGLFLADAETGVGVASSTTGDTGFSGIFSGGNFQVDLGSTSNSFIIGNLPTAAGTRYLNIDGSGNITAGAAVVSSIRYKKDVEDLEVNTADVLSLNPVRYKYIENDEEDIGLIAEDVNEYIPDLVVYNEEGEVHSVKYDRVSVYLLEVIKKQQEILDNQDEEINNLKLTICHNHPGEDICE